MSQHAIYKYLLRWEPGRYEIEMLLGSRIMGMGYSAGSPVVWAQVNLDKKGFLERRVFHVVGTAQSYDLLNEADGTFMDYIGTFHSRNDFGEIAGHIFEERAVPKTKEAPHEATG